ncbi:MAG: hypothetical protein RL115_2397 [Bacteroidota bacterium]
MTIDIKKINFPHAIAAIVVVGSFFWGWVSWNTSTLAGTDLATGNFFKTAETKFGLPNPFPQLSSLFVGVWLLPLVALVAAVFTVFKRNALLPSVIAGALGLSLVIVYYLFSQQLVELGHSLTIKPGWYVQACAALFIILLAGRGQWPLKLFVILATIAGTYLGYKIVAKQAEKNILEKTFESTNSVKADYTVVADTLIQEFLKNDTAARHKYNEKTLQVTGVAKEIKINSDSTSTIQFADSTGSYAIFSFDKADIDKVKTIKNGDAVKVKGICSGSMYSEILGITSINFKRSVIDF